MLKLSYFIIIKYKGILLLINGVVTLIFECECVSTILYGPQVDHIHFPYFYFSFYSTPGIYSSILAYQCASFDLFPFLWSWFVASIEIISCNCVINYDINNYYIGIAWLYYVYYIILYYVWNLK